MMAKKGLTYLGNGAKGLRRPPPAEVGSRATTSKRSRAAGAAASCSKHERQLSALFLASFLTCLAFLIMEACDLPQLTLLQASILDLLKKGGGECNYNVGVWLRRSRRPLYSGKECQRWLSPMWACRLDPNRSSFLYESFHWQPHACSLPPLHPPTFLHRMENRIIAFIGDSLGRQQFQSLMCLLTGGKDEYDNVLDVGQEFGFQPYVKSNKINKTKAIRPSSWAYRFKQTNTTIIFSWSPTLCHIENLQVKETNLSELSHPILVTNLSELSHPIDVPEVAFHVDRPPAFLTSYLHKLDVVVLNTGPHWNLGKFLKNRWKTHLGGNPLNIELTEDSIKNLYNYTIFTLMDWLDVQQKLGATRATIYYRTLSPHHFLQGEWNSGGRCDNAHYRFINSLSIRSLPRHFYSEFVSDFVRQHNTTIKMLNITWLSQLRDEAHISKYTLKAKIGNQDCLHWCLPGVPDTWNEILYAELLHTLKY